MQIDLSQKKMQIIVLEVVAILTRKEIAKSAQTIVHHQPFHLMLLKKIKLIKLIMLVIPHALTLITNQIEVIILRIITIIAIIILVVVLVHRAQMMLAASIAETMRQRLLQLLLLPLPHRQLSNCRLHLPLLAVHEPHPLL